LPGPANLKAVNEQEGVITLSWDPVYDAAGYVVYRKTGSEPAVQLSGTSNPLFSDGTRRHDDIISSTNLLKEGVEYTYTVVALSSHSTSRGVEVVQNGTSSVTITPAKNDELKWKGIPGQAAYTVPKVNELAVAKVTLADGTKTVQISWDKNPNPGVAYKGTFNGEIVSFESNAGKFSLSPDGKKVVYNYGLSGLTDGEQYKAEVTAYYFTKYYNAGDPAESEAYTPTSIISKFNAAVVTKLDSTTNQPTGNYEISLSWEEKPVAGVAYKLYVHKYDESSLDGDYYYSTPYEWTPVTIGTPTTGNINLRTVRLTNNLPSYRQIWVYKLVAEVESKEVDVAITGLSSAPWGTGQNLNVGTLTFTSPSSKTLQLVVSQAQKDLLVSGETVEFYAVPERYTNVERDTILGNAILIKSFTKGNLESDTVADRTAQATLPYGGSYQIRAFVLNGTQRTEVNYSVYNGSYTSTYGPSMYYYSADVSN
jgi:hypothetical protein